MPDLKGNLGFSWLRNRHTARVNMRYTGAYEDNGTANNIIGDGDLDAYYAFDVNYTYTFNVQDSSEVVLSVGAIDLFDADLPELKNGSGTDLTVFDPRGRRIYASAKYAF